MYVGVTTPSLHGHEFLHLHTCIYSPYTSHMCAHTHRHVHTVTSHTHVCAVCTHMTHIHTHNTLYTVMCMCMSMYMCMCKYILCIVIHIHTLLEGYDKIKNVTFMLGLLGLAVSLTCVWYHNMKSVCHVCCSIRAETDFQIFRTSILIRNESISQYIQCVDVDVTIHII